MAQLAYVCGWFRGYAMDPVLTEFVWYLYVPVRVLYDQFMTGLFRIYTE
jgi:hypothetical protein